MHSLQQQQQQHLLLRKSTVRFAKLFRWALSFHFHSRQCARATRLQPRLVPQHAVTMAATAGVGAGSTDTSSQISGSAALGSEELTEVKVGLAAPICDLPPTHPVVRSECGLLLTQMAVARLTALSYEVWMLRTPSGVWRGRGAVTPCASLTHPLTRPDASPGQGP